MKYKIKVPKPSAKRLESNRRLIIRESGFCHHLDHEFIIPEGVDEFEFEFEFQDNDPYINAYVLDANVYYSWFVRYQNSTGSRVEELTFELEEA